MTPAIPNQVRTPVRSARSVSVGAWRGSGLVWLGETLPRGVHLAARKAPDLAAWGAPCRVERTRPCRVGCTLPRGAHLSLPREVHVAARMAPTLPREVHVAARMAPTLPRGVHLAAPLVAPASDMGALTDTSRGKVHPTRQGGGHVRIDYGICAGSRAVVRPKSGEHGSITVWLLGLAVMVLFVGGLSLDLWRVFSARQLLGNAADAAAIAGATGIDTARFRSTGQLALDPSTAMQRVGDSLAHQGGLPLTAPPGVDVTQDPPQVVVVLTGQVRLTLLRVLLPNQRPLTIRVRAVSVPREVP
jgi:Putative Flp pilus-assembly TadE/G-like